jgi:hypothetical protein
VTLEQKLTTPQAFLTRKDLEALGLERRAIDAVLRACCVKLPGYARPLVRVADFEAWIAEHTYRGREEKRPAHENRVLIEVPRYRATAVRPT